MIGVDWGGWGMKNADDNKALVGDVLDRVATGRLRPAVPAVFRLEDAAKVLRDLEDRRVVGKVVLVL